MIALLTSSYPAFEGDHRGHFVRDFASALAVRGHDVTVLTPRMPGGRRRVFAGQRAIVEVGRPGRLFGGAGIVANLKRRPWALLDASPAWRETTDWLVAERVGIEAVVAHWLLPFGLLAAATHERHGRPVWIVGHSGGVHALAWLPAAARRWVGRVLDRGTHRLTFVTPGLRDRFLTLVGERARRALAPRCGVLPMGIDSARFEECRPDPSGPIAVVGRLTPLKGVDRLLRAVARLDGGRSVRVIGDGPARGPLESLAERLALAADFVGEQPREAIPGLLDGAKLLAVPSRRAASGRREGLPVATLEGLAAGLPVVATRSWPMPSELAGLPGVVVTDDDDRGLVRGIERALVGGAEAVSERRKRVAGAYDWAVVGAQAATIVEDLGCGPLSDGRIVRRPTPDHRMIGKRRTEL